jgi:hypothetical protein
MLYKKVKTSCNSCGCQKENRDTKWPKPKGHLDTQLFPECKGTKYDRDIVKKNKKKKNKKADSSTMTLKLSSAQWAQIGHKTGWIKKAQLFSEFDTIAIGPTPAEEKCAQAGHDDIELNRMEVRAFIKQLMRLFPIPENVNARFIMERNEHEFGVYYEAAIKYDMSDEAAADYAISVENNAPKYWDDIAKTELTSQRYFERLNERESSGEKPSNLDEV